MHLSESVICSPQSLVGLGDGERPLPVPGLRDDQRVHGDTTKAPGLLPTSRRARDDHPRRRVRAQRWSESRLEAVVPLTSHLAGLGAVHVHTLGHRERNGLVTAVSPEIASSLHLQAADPTKTRLQPCHRRPPPTTWSGPARAVHCMRTALIASFSRAAPSASPACDVYRWDGSGVRVHAGGTFGTQFTAVTARRHQRIASAPLV